MLKLAVVGKDVSRSLSPAMHAFILGKFRTECIYGKVSFPPEQFQLRAEELFSQYDAFNVTIPFKTQIIAFLRAVKGDAAVFGSVNTVVSRDRTGYNTDGDGFMLMLENAGVAVARKRALVLGAGGSGRSCIKKLTDAGAEVYAYSRTKERLWEVYREFGGFTPLGEVPIEPFDVIFNCTGVGMHNTVGQTPPVRVKGGVAPVGEELLSLCGTAVDLIYEPRESEFLRIARSLGKRTVNGEAMLFYQAYWADCIFLNRNPDASEAKAFLVEYREG